MPEINDIIETSELTPLFLWWQWTLIGIALVIALTLLVTVCKKTKSISRSAPLSPLEIALHKLKALDLNDMDSNRLAVHLSIIVRQYLNKQWADIALFETDEEFHARSHKLEKFPDTIAEQFQDYLTAVSNHKYAPNPNHPAALESLIKKAEVLLNALNSTTPNPSKS